MTERILRTLVLFLTSLVLITILIVIWRGEWRSVILPSDLDGNAPTLTPPPANILSPTPTTTSTPIRLPTPTPIRIGVAIARTGNDPHIGVLQEEAARIAEKFFNNAGGINGIPIRLTIKDTTDSVAGAEKVFNDFVAEDIVAIVGPTYSNQAVIVDQIAQDAGIPVIGPSNTRVGIPQIGEFVFRTSAGVHRFIPFGISEIHRIYPDVKNVVVVYDADDAFTISETETFTQTITENYSSDFTIIQTIRIQDPNFSTTLSSTIANSNPDLVFVSTLAEDGGTIVKQLRTNHEYRDLIMGGNGLNTPGIFALCRQACDGMLIAQSYDSKLTTEPNLRFMESYEAENKTPSQFSAQLFTAILVIIEALKKADDQSSISDMALPGLRITLKDKLQSGMRFDTPLGEIWFNAQENGELRQDVFVLTQLQMTDDESGEFVPIR